LSKIDFGLLVASGPFEIGLHASAGSARKRADRVFGAMARREWALLYLPVPFLISTGVEYEADGGLDMQKGLAVAELTPIGAGRVGLGRFTRHVTRNRIAPDGQAVTRRIPTGIRWRPWIGVGYGHVFKIDAAPTREDSSAFFRGYGRLVAALRVPVGDWLVEGALEGTAWYVGGFNGAHCRCSSAGR